MRRLSWLVIIVLALALVLTAGCGKKATPADISGTPGNPAAPTTPVSSAQTGNEIGTLLQKGTTATNLRFEGTLGTNGENYKVKGWILGGKSRIERTVGEETVIAIYDTETKMSWVWGKGEATGIKGALPAMVFESPVFWATALKDTPWKSADRATVGNISCRVVKFAYGAGTDAANTTLWIAEDSGLPVKLDVNFDGEKTAFEYTFTTEAPDAALFVAPTNITFVEIPK